MLIGFFLAAAFFAVKGFFLTTLRFLDTDFLAADFFATDFFATDFFATDFFAADFFATTFLREAVVFFRFLLAVFFAGIFGLLPGREKAGIIHGLRADGSLFFPDFRALSLGARFVGYCGWAYTFGWTLLDAISCPFWRLIDASQVPRDVLLGAGCLAKETIVLFPEFHYTSRI